MADLKHTIVVDWGSSSFRAYLLDADLKSVDQVRNGHGVLHISQAFEKTLMSACQAWLESFQIEDVIIIGAIGSREGWVEVPYVSCPVTVKEIVQSALEPTTSLPLKIHIMPGVKGFSPCGMVDVMRGEETLLLGAIKAKELTDAFVCLPGTHSKWIEVSESRIKSFATLITGELFAMLQKSEGTIGALLNNEEVEELDSDSFIEGLKDYCKAMAKQEASLLHILFSQRAKFVSSESEVKSQSAYLSGLIVADEVYNAKKMFPTMHEVVLVTDAKFKDIYQEAFSLLNLKSIILDSEKMFLLGIRRIINEML